MAKTIRVTLDITLRPLTSQELSENGADDLDEDCRPTGDDADLDEVDPEELADLAAYAIKSSDDMWGGSSLYAAVNDIEVVSAEDR